MAKLKSACDEKEESHQHRAQATGEDGFDSIIQMTPQLAGAVPWSGGSWLTTYY